MCLFLDPGSLFQSNAYFLTWVTVKLGDNEGANLAGKK